MIDGGGEKVSSQEKQSLESEGKLLQIECWVLQWLIHTSACMILCSHFLLNGDENFIDGYDYVNIITLLFNISLLSCEENLSPLALKK